MNVSQPVFFSNPRIISLERHKNVRINNFGQEMGFARATNFIPLVCEDIALAAKYYPIAFTIHDPVIPIAIVGLETYNYFIDEKNHWLKNHYIPAYVRKYPFALLENTSSNELTLCLDEAAIALEVNSNNDRLYNDSGTPSDFAQSALDLCVSYQEEYHITHQFCSQLMQLDMFTPHNMNAQLITGRMIRLNEFQLINTDKLPLLSEENIISFYKRGIMALLYYIIQSQSNWGTLLELASQKELLTNTELKM